jgi:hypothetical protein
MRVDWKPDNRPEVAQLIAGQTMMTIRAMNEAKSIVKIADLYEEWCGYARRMRVAPQIVQHMKDKHWSLAGSFTKPKAPSPDRKTQAAGGANE